MGKILKKGDAMKRSNGLPFFLFTVLPLSLISFFVASAHSGRTDSNGGHWNHATGEYHYHSGEYAGKSSSSVKPKEYEYERFTPKYEPPAKQDVKIVSIEEEEEDKSIFVDIVLPIIISLTWGIPLLAWFLMWLFLGILPWLKDLLKSLFRKIFNKNSKHK